MIPAAAAAVVVVGALAAYLTLGRGTQPTTAATPAAAPAAAAAPKSPDATPASLDGATLKVSSEPTGASIILDGRDTKQTTPASITLKGSGPFKLQLTKRGFASKTSTSKRADVRSGSVNYTLEEAKVVIVPIAISSAYPVEVFEGGRSISKPNDNHQLKLPAGTTIRVRNPEYLLDASVRVDGKTDYQAPPLGSLTVLTRYETCNVKVGAKDVRLPADDGCRSSPASTRLISSVPADRTPNGQFVTIDAEQYRHSRGFNEHARSTLCRHRVALFALAASRGRAVAARGGTRAAASTRAASTFSRAGASPRRSRIFRPSSIRSRRARSLTQRSCKSRCTSSTSRATRMRRKPPPTSC